MPSLHPPHEEACIPRCRPTPGPDANQARADLHPQVQAKAAARSHLGMLTPRIHPLGSLSPSTNPARGGLHPQMQARTLARSHLGMLTPRVRWVAELTLDRHRQVDMAGGTLHSAPRSGHSHRGGSELPEITLRVHEVRRPGIPWPVGRHRQRKSTVESTEHSRGSQHTYHTPIHINRYDISTGPTSDLPPLCPLR